MGSQETPYVESWSAERLCRATYKDIGTPGQVEDRFHHHLLSNPACRKSLQVLLKSQSTTTRDFSLEIDAFDLLQADPILGHLLLRFPATLLPLLENAIVKAQKFLLQTSEDIGEKVVKGDQSDAAQNITRVHARLVHLPPTCCKTSLASMDASDVGKILQVSGTVVRASPVQMYESARTYKCTGKHGCGKQVVVYADLEQKHNALVTPDSCPLMLDSGERCKGTKMEVVMNGSIHTDFQEIKIQEAASRLSAGHIPRSLLIKLQHDLAQDKCQPGDEVVLVGSLLAQWQSSVTPDVECNVGMALKAHSIRVLQEKGASAWNNSEEGGNNVGELEKMRKEFDLYWQDPVNEANPIAARDFICKAVCPKLYGMAMVKLGLLVTLIGGVSCDVNQDQGQRDKNLTGTNRDSRGASLSQQDNDDAPDPFRVQNDRQTQSFTTFNYGEERNLPMDGNPHHAESVQTRRRDQSHLLLVGDPGTGKSQFLRFAAALCPRSVLTTGVGTTSAGLTCAAVREGNGKEFVLEAGALVLADKGVCCIDEFGCIQPQDRTTIHEAMEQQTLSVAKAGIVCKLNCRATIIAVMNPKDSLYDNHASLSRNTGLGTPLLSRFDIIFKLVDTSDASRDSNITSYLLNRAIQGAGFDTNNSNGRNERDLVWTMEKLRAYISIVKGRFNPVVSDGAALLLERHFEKLRMSGGSTIPITVRFLESMIRLSQAHARLMYRATVTLEDACAVLRIMECSAMCYGGFDGNVDDVASIMYQDPMTMDFSSNADMEFLCFEYDILEKYGMLEHICNDKRSKILKHRSSAQDVADSSGWPDVENPSDRLHNNFSAPVEVDHYGRVNFSTQGRRPSVSDESKRTAAWAHHHKRHSSSVVDFTDKDGHGKKPRI
jgi:DNA helicase MCM9